MPSDKLAAHILRQPTLLSYTEEALQRNYASVVAAVGDEGTAQLLVSGFPDVLEGAEDKVPRNLQALQQLGASPEAALRVLVSNGRLAGQDLEQPKFAARVAFWQQAYGIKSTGAWSTAGLPSAWNSGRVGCSRRFPIASYLQLLIPCPTTPLLQRLPC